MLPVLEQFQCPLATMKLDSSEATSAAAASRSRSQDVFSESSYNDGTTQNGTRRPPHPLSGRAAGSGVRITCHIERLRWLQELESRAVPVCWDNNGGGHWHTVTVLEPQGNSSAGPWAPRHQHRGRSDEAKAAAANSIINVLKSKNLNASALNWQTSVLKTQAELLVDRAAALMPLRWCGRGAVTTPLPLRRTDYPSPGPESPGQRSESRLVERRQLSRCYSLSASGSSKFEARCQC
jgi:hypothetical protein